MPAARAGRPDQAIETLLGSADPREFWPNGYNCYVWSVGPQVYLPGNGATLTAVAMMAAGWDGCPKRNAPGFPDDGQWVVKWEGLKPMF